MWVQFGVRSCPPPGTDGTIPSTLTTPPHTHTVLAAFTAMNVKYLYLLRIPAPNIIEGFCIYLLQILSGINGYLNKYIFNILRLHLSCK